ncbi:hypothetical protein QR680_003108 [Steinernema hermaphroditum]|uniref:Piwi domain-containing protein n=1 Tax=Steinernema hermaphroditum TaxID=289476 RepID=A0AA39H7L8_9BILA|nr:hypothetical protein QR680_003108 [Steinernema hermaphroditum]
MSRNFKGNYSRQFRNTNRPSRGASRGRGSDYGNIDRRSQHDDRSRNPHSSQQGSSHVRRSSPPPDDPSMQADRHGDRPSPNPTSRSSTQNSTRVRDEPETSASTANIGVELEPENVVRMNAFRFNMTKAPRAIHVYELIFAMYRKVPKNAALKNRKVRTNARIHDISEIGLGYNEFDDDDEAMIVTDMLIGPTDSVRKQKRKALVFQLFRHLLAENQKDGQISDFPGSPYDYAYDTVRTLYTPNDIQDNMCNLEKENLPKAILDQLVSTPFDCITAFVKKCGTTFDLHNFGTESDPLVGVEHFLETLTWQHAFERMNDQVVYGSKNFMLNAGKPLKHVFGLSTAVGFEKTVELIPDPNPDYTSVVRPFIPVLHMTPKFELFFDIRHPKRVSDFCAIFFQCQSTKELERKLNGEDKEYHLYNIAPVLKGAIVQTNHRNDGRQDTFMIDHVEKRSAHDIYIECEGDMKMSVAEYMNDRYDFTDCSKTLPCIARKYKDAYSYYPMNVVELLPNQKVVSPYISETIKEAFKTACYSLAENAVNNISQAMTDLNLTRAADEYQSSSDVVQVSNPYLQTFKITIESSELVQIAAKHTKAPIIVQKNYFSKPVGGKWALWKQAKPIQAISPVVSKPFRIGIVNTCPMSEVPLDELGTFTKKIFGWMHTLYDMKLDQSKDVVLVHDFSKYFGMDKRVSDMLQKAEETIEKCKLRHVIVICSGNKDDLTHDVWKLAEMTNRLTRNDGKADIVVTTQCLTPKTFKDVICKSTYNDEKLTSIIMKLNLKLGGTNYCLKESHVSDEPSNMAIRHIRPTRMFVGIDLKQPERQRFGEPNHNPTVVGFSYSTPDPNFMLRGTYWYQHDKQADMEMVRSHLKHALQRFSANGGALPIDIFMYWRVTRQSQDMSKEKAALLETISQCYSHQDFRPKFVLITVETKPKIRLFPNSTSVQGHSAKQNVMAGSFIQERFATPNFTLVSHCSDGGLAQPVRFTVNVHHGDMSAEELAALEVEELTNTLCYLQNTANRSTSVPAPLYSAMDLSKRGMSNYQTLDMAMMEEDGNGELLRKKKRTPEQWQKHYDSVLRQMPVPHRESKFWA